MEQLKYTGDSTAAVQPACSTEWGQAFQDAAEEMNIGSYSHSAKSAMRELFRRGYISGKTQLTRESDEQV